MKKNEAGPLGDLLGLLAMASALGSSGKKKSGGQPDDFLASVLGTLSSGPKPSGEDLKMIYDLLVEPHREIIAALPSLGGKAGKDLSPFAATALGFIAEIVNDPQVYEGFEKATRGKAKMKFAKLKGLIDAGFERSEAMAILLAGETAASPLAALSAMNGKKVSIEESAPAAKPPRRRPAKKAASTAK